MNAKDARKMAQFSCDGSTTEKVLSKIEEVARQGEFELYIYSELNFGQIKDLEKLGYKLKNLGGTTMDANHKISW